MTRQTSYDRPRVPFWRLSLMSCPLGGSIIYVFSCISTGQVIGLDAVFTALFFLTICTLGIGTIVLLIGATALGFVIVGPTWLLLKQSQATQRPPSTSPTLSPSLGESSEPTTETTSTSSAPTIASSLPLDLDSDQQAVIDYISHARDRGFSDRQIIERLSSQGWTEGEITEGFQWANRLAGVSP